MATVEKQYFSEEEKAQIITEQLEFGLHLVGEKNHSRGLYAGNWLLFDAPTEKIPTETEKLQARVTDLEAKNLALETVLKEKAIITELDITSAKEIKS